MKTIIFTGGGRSDRVIPGKNLILEIQEFNPDIKFVYIGGKENIEREIIKKLGVTYFPI